jgi:anti-sigma factor RsiW
MVTGTHPEDVELFDYVEGELSRGRRAEVEMHLASCAHCAEHLARVQAGRDALRGAQFLELPAARREAILRELPAQRPARDRVPWLSAKRVITVLATIAVVAATVAAVVTTGGGPSGEEEGAAVTGAGAPEAGATNRSTEQDAAGALAPLIAPGPADAVADELRRKGFDARVVGKHVEVRNTTRAKVRHALEDARLMYTAKNRVKIFIFP